jgi:formylglycine-generating enzyme required for sulfatase activity
MPRQPMWSADDHPVVNLTWQEAADYCAWVRGRLPTEAEWEFAARAAANTRYPWGDAFDPSRANGARTNGRDRWPYTAPVASFPANPFGLHDMIGNVWEWTSDWHQRGAPAPSGPESPYFRRAVRGGSWINNPESLRLDRRLGLSPAGRHNFYIGFRCAR